MVDLFPGAVGPHPVEHRIVILLFAPVGPIAWFVAGRPRPVVTNPRSWHPAGGRGGPRPPRRDLAPDDEDEERTRKWEADLRRRKEELRRRDAKDEPESADG